MPLYVCTCISALAFGEDSGLGVSKRHCCPFGRLARDSWPVLDVRVPYLRAVREEREGDATGRLASICFLVALAAGVAGVAGVAGAGHNAHRGG